MSLMPTNEDKAFAAGLAAGGLFREPKKILSWDKPKKLRPSKEHNDRYQSDSGVAGTYVPNMSAEDKRKWKAKLIKGEDPRVEIRKTIDRDYAHAHSSVQMLMVVRMVTVSLSFNGTAHFNKMDYDNLTNAVHEARTVLAKETL